MLGTYAAGLAARGVDASEKLVGEVEGDIAEVDGVIRITAIRLHMTAPVPEAYLRLLKDRKPQWANRAHFFTAAAEAMRRILIERARRKNRLKRGGDQQRVELESSDGAFAPRDATLLALDEALSRLEELDADMADVVKLRYFAGLTAAETAKALDVTERTVYRHWAAARSWLHRELDS